jgi:drug/metabolite transporter superfamily protein YnfA
MRPIDSLHPGVDGASGLLGIGFGLTLALQATTMRQSEVSTVYAALATFSRLCALTRTYFALVGIFLVARIPWGWP